MTDDNSSIAGSGGLFLFLAPAPVSLHALGYLLPRGVIHRFPAAVPGRACVRPCNILELLQTEDNFMQSIPFGAKIYEGSIKVH